MSDKTDQPQDKGKTDWSFTDKSRRMGGSLSPARGQLDQPSHRTEPPFQIQSDDIHRPEADLPNPSGIGGIILNWKRNVLSRRAALQAVELHINSELDALEHSLKKSLQIRNSRADVLAEEYLKDLDAKHLSVLYEIGLRNKESRERALMELTDMTVKRLKEVQDKDWPDELKHDTINELFTLRRRVVAEIMKELGSEG